MFVPEHLPGCGNPVVWDKERGGEGIVVIVAAASYEDATRVRGQVGVLGSRAQLGHRRRLCELLFSDPFSF